MRGIAMTDKKIGFRSVAMATFGIALGLAAWSGAARYFASNDQARVKPFVGGASSELPMPQLSRVRLLVSNLN
jgi:hypothetical protein